jgi:hypothetical protein
MLRLAGRLLLVPIGLALAAVAALAVVATLGLERLTHAAHGRDLDLGVLGDLWRLAKVGLALGSTTTAVLVLLLVVIGETARIRSSLYYIFGGGAVLAGPALLAGGFDGPSLLPKLWQTLATAGFAAGLVYWLVAGRRA